MEQRSKERNAEIGANADSAIGCCIVQCHDEYVVVSGTYKRIKYGSDDVGIYGR